MTAIADQAATTNGREQPKIAHIIGTIGADERAAPVWPGVRSDLDDVHGVIARPSAVNVGADPRGGECLVGASDATGHFISGLTALY